MTTALIFQGESMVAYEGWLNRRKWNAPKASLISLFCGLLGAGFFVPFACAAQEVMAGWEGNSFSGNGAVTAAFTIPLSQTSAIMIRPAASYLYYDVRQIGLVTEVSAPALSLGIGYRYSDTRVTFDISPAVQVLWERRKMIGGTTTERRRVGAGIASGLSFQATPLTFFNLVAGYDTSNKYFTSRAGIKRRITDLQLQKPWWVQIGAEIIAQGNDETRQLSGGGLAEIAFDRGKSALQLRAGYSWFTYPDHSKLERPYLGAGLYHRF